MNRLLILTALCSLSAACASTSRDVVQTGHVLGKMIPANNHIVDIEFDEARVEGTASGTQILWFIEYGPESYSDGLAYKDVEPREGFTGLLRDIGGWFFGLVPNFGGRIRSAAVREACDLAECDLLGYPMYYIDETNYFLWREVTITVKGFPGYVNSLTNVPAPQEESKGEASQESNE